VPSLAGSVPATPDALRHRADALLQAGRWHEALSAYEGLLAVAPLLAEGWYNFAYVLGLTGRFAQAIACYDRAIQLGIAKPEDAWRNKGLILAEQLARPLEAAEALRQALRCNDRLVAGWVDLGRVAEQMGRQDEARAAYERALAVDPSSALALAHRANVADVRVADADLLARLRDAVSDSSRSPAELASLGFALGKSLDAVGHYDDAFAAYSQANLATRASAGPQWGGYDRSAWEHWIRRLPQWFPGHEPADVQAAPDEPRLIFILGMFRSGSTLVESILSSHPQVTAGGELDFIPRIARDLWAHVRAGGDPQDPQRLDAARAHYLQSVRVLYPGAEVITDKRPDNFLHLGLIRRLFPAARIIHTFRDPLDTCLSIFFTHFDPAQTYTTDLLDIAHWHRLHDELMSNWQSQHPEAIAHVGYEALIQNPGRQISDLLAFLGLPWDDACLDFHQATRAVQTPSVWQVRRPLYASSCGRWRNYRSHIASLASALA
jgi:tetratricopeptide (TPR) repeat protein